MIDPSIHQQILARSFLFSCQGTEEFEGLARTAKRMSVSNGAVIFNKNDAGRRMFAIIEGGVKIGTVSETGHEIVFGLLGAGDFFGEISLLDGHPRSATATALGDVELLAIDRKDFLACMESNPRIAINLLHALARRMRDTDVLIEDGAFLSLSARLAKRLLHLSGRHGVPTPDGTRIGVRLSQQEIANMVGAARESVNKLLRLWSREGLIRQAGGYLTIVDPAGLENASGP